MKTIAALSLLILALACPLFAQTIHDYLISDPDKNSQAAYGVAFRISENHVIVGFAQPLSGGYEKVAIWTDEAGTIFFAVPRWR